MNINLQAQLKAIVAGVVGFIATWIAQRYGVKVDTPEVQGAIIAVVLYVVTYFTPNKDKPA